MGGERNAPGDVSDHFEPTTVSFCGSSESRGHSKYL